MRILFLGQKEVGERCFDYLIGAQDEHMQICAVSSNIEIDRWWGTNQIYEHCKQANIPFVSNAKRNNELLAQMIKKCGIDIIISVQHSWIIPPSVLELVGYFAFNLHNAKLPDYMGYNACNHAILNGDTSYTSTIHWMADKVDTGAIAFEKTFDIKRDETAQSLYKKAISAGESAFRELVNCLKTGKSIPRIPVDASQGKFYHRNSLDTIREITDLSDLTMVDRKARAFFFPPFEPAYIRAAGVKYYVVPVY
jgi:methionyl-tRNA formyltransferase